MLNIYSKKKKRSYIIYSGMSVVKYNPLSLLQYVSIMC